MKVFGSYLFFSNNHFRRSLKPKIDVNAINCIKFKYIKYYLSIFVIGLYIGLHCPKSMNKTNIPDLYM